MWAKRLCTIYIFSNLKKRNILFREKETGIITKLNAANLTDFPS